MKNEKHTFKLKPLTIDRCSPVRWRPWWGSSAVLEGESQGESSGGEPAQRGATVMSLPSSLATRPGLN